LKTPGRASPPTPFKKGGIKGLHLGIRPPEKGGIATSCLKCGIKLHCCSFKKCGIKGSHLAAHPKNVELMACSYSKNFCSSNK
jgi:hypothetical protein